MTEQYLLDHIKASKELQCSDDLIAEMYPFKVKQVRPTVMSVLLQMEGHAPESDLVFSVDKLRNWCHSNDISYFYDPHTRVHNFKLNEDDKTKKHSG